MGDREREVDIDATEFAGDAAPDCNRPPDRCDGAILGWVFAVEGRMLGGRIVCFLAGGPAPGRVMPAIRIRYCYADRGVTE
jgi:hypothetical protein